MWQQRGIELQAGLLRIVKEPETESRFFQKPKPV